MHRLNTFTPLAVFLYSKPAYSDLRNRSKNPRGVEAPGGAAHSWIGGISNMRNDSNRDKNFVQPEKKYYRELFSRRSKEGPAGIQTIDEYVEEMREIEAALREFGEVL